MRNHQLQDRHAENNLQPPSAVLLVGGGRNARNLICTLESANVSIIGVVDDRPRGDILGYKVGHIDDVSGSDVNALLTISDPVLAEMVRKRPALSSCQWPTVIHPSSLVSSYSRIGEGCYLGPFCTTTDNILGRHVHLFTHNVLGARVSIDDFSVVLPHATLASDVRVGKRCVVGMGARIHAGVTIGNDCRIGVNAVVRRDLADNSIAICRDPTITRTRLTLGKRTETQI